MKLENKLNHRKFLILFICVHQNHYLMFMRNWHHEW